MFDVYGLPPDFPDLGASHGLSDIYKRAQFLEDRFGASLAAQAPGAGTRFVPYLQMHEFEALVFSDLLELEALEREWSGYARGCMAEVAKFATPEHINDAVATAPSKRLQKHFVCPMYRKALHGVMAIEAMGLARVRSRCVRFNNWLDRLVALPDIP